MKTTLYLIALFLGPCLTLAFASEPTKAMLSIDDKGSCRLELRCDPMDLLLGKSSALVPEGERQKLAEATPSEITFRVERIKEILLSQTLVKTDQGTIPLQFTQFPDQAVNQSRYPTPKADPGSSMVVIILDGQLPVNASSVWVQFPRFLGTVTFVRSQPLHPIRTERVIPGETSTGFALPRVVGLSSPMTARLWAIFLSSSFGLAVLWLLRARVSSLLAWIGDHRRNRRLRTSH